MIRIFADLYGASQPPADARHVASVADYVTARCAARAALDREDNLTLYITDLVVLQWFSDLQRYPTSLVDWHDMRPEATFEQLFGTPPTLPFTANLLAVLALETLPPPPPASQADPIAYILGQRLGPYWSHTHPPTGHFERVVVWAASCRDWISGPLNALVTYQLARWTATDARFSTLRAETLPTDARLLLIRAALRRYDATWRQAQPWGMLPEIAIEGIESLVIEVLHPLHDKIANYWTEQFTRSDRAMEMVDLAIVQFSGLSMAEVDAMDWMIDQHPARLSVTLLDQIERRFALLPAARDRLVQLSRRVAQPVPVLPESDWGTARWLRWATGEYFPYFGWVIRANQPRDHQIACSKRFADWVFDQYPHWLNDDDAPLARRQHSELRELLESDARAAIIWMVIDGMAWWHGEMLRSLCEQHGLYPQEHTPSIAALPSITSIAKRALVTGMSTTDIDQPTIKAAASRHFARIGISARVTYRMNEALATLRAGDPRCILVLDNTIDEVAHQHRDFTDTLGIRGHLQEIAAALGKAREICAQQGRRLHILIGSDHGGTLLPDDAIALPLPRSVKPIEETWEDETLHTDAQKHSPRAAIIDDVQHIPAQERARWYILDRDQFQLERHYLAPRGYTYLKPRPGGWTHGGLTPEELVVPLLHLMPEALQIEPMRLTFNGTLLPRHESTIQVTLINANRFPLEQIIVKINGVEYARLDQIGAANSATLALTFPAVISQANTVSVTWCLRYRAFGVEQRDDGQASLTVRRLSVEDTGLDDFFGDE